MTLLIKNGLVYDGTGRSPLKQDILISGQKIFRLGNFPALRADKILDATGAMVLPGFIDVAATLDHYFDIFSAAAQEKLIKNGVTTIIGGNGGLSLAPFTRKSAALMNEMGDNRYRHVDWYSVNNFLSLLNRKHIFVNFGTLVGYATIRESFTKGEARDLTRTELLAIKQILEQSFKEKAFGFSLELDSFYGRSVPYEELKIMAGLASRFNRVVVLGLRYSREDTTKALHEILKLTKETGVNLELSHFTPFRNFVDDYLQSKKLFEKTAAKTRIDFDLNPLGESVLPAYSLLPIWFEQPQLKAMVSSLIQPIMREKLLDYFSKFDLNKIRIVKTSSHLRFLEGKTLREFAVSRNLHDAPAILKFLALTELQAVVALQNVDLKALDEFLVSTKAIVVGGDLPNAFADFLISVKRNNILPLEKAVAKATVRPAKKYEIVDRGLLKEGYFADVVVMSEDKVRDVVLNGNLVLVDGKSQPAAMGQILKPAN